MKSVVQLLTAAGKDFIRDRAMTYSAAIAYFTALSFAPLVLLLVTAGTFLGEGTGNDLIRFFERQVGEQAAVVTESVIEHGASGDSRQATWRVVVGIGLLLFTASAVFAQLQAALNHMWEVEPSPGQGVWGWVRKRLLSIGMVFAILFILLVALVLSAVVERLVPGGTAVARIGSLLLSLLLFTGLFAAIYKVLPDVEIAWADVWLGAAVTAVIFSLGKLGISLFLDRSSATDNYGAAAGSLIALLIWVYFSALIFFFGAEVAQQHARRRGAGITPSKHARRLSPRPRAEAAAQSR